MLPVWYAEQENAAQSSSDGIGRPASDMLCADVNLYWGLKFHKGYRYLVLDANGSVRK
jgi:hypothetical protein